MKQILGDDCGMGPVLRCVTKGCDDSNVHITKAQIFMGPDDHHADFMVQVDNRKNIEVKNWKRSEGPTHYNRKRDDLDVIWFGHCEFCGHETEYRLLFHKGATYFQIEDHGETPWPE